MYVATPEESLVQNHFGKILESSREFQSRIAPALTEHHLLPRFPASYLRHYLLLRMRCLPGVEEVDRDLMILLGEVVRYLYHGSGFLYKEGERQKQRLFLE